MFRKKYVFAVIYSLVLILFTTYTLLDTFVIVQKEKKAETEDYYNSLYADEENKGLDETSEETTDKPSHKGKEHPFGKGGFDRGEFGKGGKRPGGHEKETEIDNSNALDVNTYKDDNISITVTKYRENDTDIYVADVKVSSMKYLKTALADETYGRNVTAKTSETAKNKNAILAINGDYYGARSSGYVIRNGVLYRHTASENQEALVIKTDGSFEIITEGKTSAISLLDNGAAHVLSFGPALVQDGKISVTTEDEVGKARTSNPRTAIGLIDKLHYVFVVADGRTSESEGLSLYQLAEFIKKLDVETAYNLDGGGSSTMYFNGNIVNRPTTGGNSISERSVSDIVYIGN